MVIAALEGSGQRGIIGSGWSGIQEEHLPGFVHLVGFVPHTWLFPRVAAVVHHGDVGRTAAGLRAGVPSIITPFFGDQAYWGRRIYELGVGPRPIPNKQLNSEKLGRAIGVAVSDEAMKERAADLGYKTRNENGVSAAVRVLQRTSNAT